jgi:phosphohistidine phosphatase SixA
MRINRRLVTLALALFAVAGCGAAPKPEIAPTPTGAVSADGGEGGPVIVYVVRHAEKLVAADNPKDPPLTEGGTQRAAALAKAIDPKALVAVYATPFTRTRSTAAPCAEAAGIPVIEYPPDDTAGLVAEIREVRKGSVLVVGHSNTVPEILTALGASEAVTLTDDDFGDLFVVALAPDGTATMERKRFGD